MGSIFKEYGVKSDADDDNFPVEVIKTWVHYLSLEKHRKHLKRRGERLLLDLKDLVKKKKAADEEYENR